MTSVVDVAPLARWIEAARTAVVRACIDGVSSDVLRRGDYELRFVQNDAMNRLLIAALLLCSFSCIATRPSVQIQNPDIAENTTFPGIRESLERDPVTRILVVHGMGTHGVEPHETTYAHGLLQGLQRQLKLTTLSQCKTVDVLPTNFGASSSVDRCSYQYKNGHELRIYILTWSKLTEYFEDTILKPDWTKYGDTRIRINRQLKEQLIDKSFDDAVLYAGAFAPTMRKSVVQALCVLLTDKTEPTKPCTRGDLARFEQSFTFRVDANRSDIFLISHSLGSVMVIETLKEMLEPVPDEEDPFANAPSFAAEQFVANLQLAALMANQLPLLYLSRIQPDGSPPPPTEGELNLSSAIWKRGADRRLPIVAFNDPNDLLTFPLPAGWRDRIARDRIGQHGDRIDVINVFLTNAPYRWFGVVVNPARAHTGYWTNDLLVKLLVEGHTAGLTW